LSHFYYPLSFTLLRTGGKPANITTIIMAVIMQKAANFILLFILSRTADVSGSAIRAHLSGWDSKVYAADPLVSPKTWAY